MPRLPNDVTAAERAFTHQMKMAGKKFDAARRERMGLAPSFANYAFGSIAHGNRHTNAPHAHAREIARNARRAASVAQ